MDLALRRIGSEPDDSPSTGQYHQSCGGLFPASQLAGKGSRLFIVLLLAVSLGLALSGSSFGGLAAEGNTAQGGQQLRGEIHRIILITGDVVEVANYSGKRVYTMLPSNGSSREFQMLETTEGTYILPVGIDMGLFDIGLFNIDYLIDEGYNRLDYLPVIISVRPVFNPERKIIGTLGEAREGGDVNVALDRLRSMRGVSVLKTHPKISVAFARISEAEMKTAYASLRSEPSIGKVWLDKKRRISLSESVPLIGAPSLWAQGYNGSRTKIAILDTGIDASHPDLDDLDDNPATSDPKVVRAIDFTDDRNAIDLHGHGTHVASTAAGTGYASNHTYRGVAPGAYLWNMKVLNRFGWGYDSWIINGILNASLGADGIAGTGDEADIISMSLGGAPTDGIDPLSQAVNAAVDAGIVVVVAAGNAGDYFTVSTPGAADKVITVGATDKSDNLAWFSSRGPTLDYRVKPDVVAPGVNIIAARASSTTMGNPVNNYYTSASGTSMATPHVAGAAALILQKAKDSIPDWILERPGHYNVSPVPYNWIDGITGGTMGITGDDVATSAIDIGFNFTFYGKNYSQLYFSTNGIITFDNPTTTYWNVPIPDPSPPNNFIAPFWDDLNVVSGIGSTYYKLDTTSDPKKSIITWKDVYKYGGYSNPVTFEAVLFSDGGFLFQYKNISNIGAFDQTIGAENSDGSSGLQYAYNSPLADQSAVIFIPRATQGIGKPSYVKNVLVSTAKDLNLSVYDQGGGRIYLPNATKAQVLINPATTSFKILEGVNTSVITFYNLNTTSYRNLTFYVKVKDMAGNTYPDAAYPNVSSLSLPPNSSAAVLLTVNATSLPRVLFSGEIKVLADNSDVYRAIFGFVKMNKLTINKIDRNGSAAAYDWVWAYKANKTSWQDSWSAFDSTDANGTATMFVPDGYYNVWSLGYTGNWMWVAKDKLAVFNDTNITLDERTALPITFDPNKANQIFAALYSGLAYNESGAGWSWIFLSSYPSNVTTFAAPTGVNVFHSYEYYPSEYYDPYKSWLINTPEWHKLFFAEQGFNSAKSYAANYSRLVNRSGHYFTALVNETAVRAEWAEAMNIYAPVWISYGWDMSLPQKRTEWISPDTYYSGILDARDWEAEKGWYFHEWDYHNYSAGAQVDESWNAQPFTWHHVLERGSNWIDIEGHIFRDKFGSHYYHYYAWPPASNFSLYRNGILVTNYTTDGYFWYYNSSEPSSASYLVVLEGTSGQLLATKSKTILNFTYSGSGDYRPPKIYSRDLPKHNLRNMLLENSGLISLNIVDELESGYSEDGSTIASVSLDYSLDDGATWISVPLVQSGGVFSGTLSNLSNGSFISFRAYARDNAGNSAYHEIIRALYAGAEYAPPPSPPAYLALSGNAKVLWNTTIQGLSCAHSCHGGDYDLDGAPDIVAHSRGSAKVSLLSGRNGTKVWERVLSGSDAWTWDRGVDDLDGDSGNDLAVEVEWYNGSAYLENLTALRGRTGEELWRKGPFVDGYFQLVLNLGDVSGDGRNDLLLNLYNWRSPYAFNLSAVRGIDGVELWGRSYSSSDWLWVWPRLAGDLNRDGRQDVLIDYTISSGGSTTAGIEAVSGTNGAAIWSKSGDYYAVPAGDLSGDSYADVVVSANATTAAIRGYDASQLWNASGWLVNVIRDVNGDNKGDVVVEIENIFGEKQLSALSGSNGTQIWSTNLGMRADWIMGMPVKDLNGDGRDDIIAVAVARWYDGYWYYYNFTFFGISGSNGSMMWSRAWNNLLDGWAWAEDAGDLTGDGRGDVAVAVVYRNSTSSDYAYYNNVTALKGDSGTKLWEVQKKDWDEPSLQFLGDFDGDAKGDVVVAGSYADSGGYASSSMLSARERQRILESRNIDTRAKQRILGEMDAQERFRTYTAEAQAGTLATPTPGYYARAFTGDSISSTIWGANSSSWMYRAFASLYEPGIDYSGDGFKDAALVVNDTIYMLVRGTFANDTTPPTITFVAPTPANGSTIVQNYVYVNVTSSEPLSTALLEWNGVNESILGLGANWYLNKTSLANGVYSFRVWGRDFAGNWNSTEVRVVTVSVPPPSYGAVSGYVVNESGAAIAGALVRAEGTSYNATTASDGGYTIASVPAGTYNITASASGYFKRSKKGISVLANATAYLNFTLLKLPSITPTPYAMNFYGYATLDNIGVAAGDVVTAYDSNGTACGNFTVTTAGIYGFMPCYGDALDTSADEGAVTGDRIAFKINGYNATAVGNTTWIDKGQENVNLSARSEAVRTVEIPLVVGWNLVSIPLELPDTSVPSVLASIAGNYSRVMAYENGYLTYDPALPEFSTLRNLTYRMGFWVKMKNASLLRATGAEPIDKSIPLITGWNLVGYLKDSNMSVPSALASIEGNYSRVMAYENGYKTYDPALPEFSTLQEMKPYLGYWIKATRPEVLEY